MAKLAYPTRILTAAPLMAGLLFTLLYLLCPAALSDTAHYMAALVWFVLLPLLAYPVSWLVPALRRRGRAVQRGLAIAFSVTGYLGGLLCLAVCGGTRTEWIIYLTYAISGLLIALCSALLHFKASGHACGVAGPAAMLVYCLGLPWLAGFVLLAAVFWSSLKMKRHTLAQLTVGSLIPVVTIALLTRLLP